MQPSLIYDVGAHKGEDTDFYLKKGFSVVAIEANPDLAKGIEARFRKEIDAGRLFLIAAAVAPAAGWAEFYISSRHSVWGTTERAWADRNEKMGAPSTIRRVPAVAFEDVLREHGVPYYLKIDIEGADLLCLEALRQFEHRPKYVSIESDKVSWENLLREFALLRALGYDDFKVIDQCTVEEQVPPDPSREGVHAAHTFESGSSGLFGEELPGEWLTEERALSLYRRIFVRYRLFGDNTLGSKIVKRLPLARRLRPHWYDTHARHRGLD